MHINEAKEIIKASYRYFYEKLTVGTGERIIIKVRRDSLEWTYIIKGKQSGQWVTNYGLGFDLSSPVVFFGYNLMCWHNIGVSGGVVFQQQYRLKNQYSENEYISLSLEKDQLHDKIYMLNVFISINFRFGENPFKTNQPGVGEK